MRVEIELGEEDLDLVKEKGIENRRSRKAQIEWIVEDWADRVRQAKELKQKK